MKCTRIPILYLALHFSMLICFSQAIHSQTVSIYDQNAIYFQSNGYIKNGQIHRYGFLYNKLRAEMQVSEEAMVEWKIFKKHQTLSLIGTPITITSLLLAYDSDDRTINIPLVILGLTTGVLTNIASNKSQNALHKAVFYRNRSFLMQ